MCVCNMIMHAELQLVLMYYAVIACSCMYERKFMIIACIYIITGKSLVDYIALESTNNRLKRLTYVSRLTYIGRTR